MKDKNETAGLLNDLILINNDRIAGYERAIKEARQENADLIPLFQSMIAESHRIKTALATEIQALGSTIEQGTTASGKIYRAWMDVKAVFTGHDRKTVLANCEAGEDAAQKAYSSALEEEGLPAYIRELLAEQQEILMESHNHVRALRNQYKGEAAR